MRVEVKQRHIDQALALRAARGGINSRTCPIALAMKEQTKIPVAASAMVDLSMATIFMAGQLVGQYIPSGAAKRFIIAFDSGEPVAPHTFQFAPAK